mmetsp:Transcript_6548/g.19214  ORF Transcript_6548/g.19214 Transcript_6548/m.19214 type:complete len:204 (+) Transcript_6548:1532-2143(+)
MSAPSVIGLWWWPALKRSKPGASSGCPVNREHVELLPQRPRPTKATSLTGEGRARSSARPSPCSSSASLLSKRTSGTDPPPTHGPAAPAAGASSPSWDPRAAGGAALASGGVVFLSARPPRSEGFAAPAPGRAFSPSGGVFSLPRGMPPEAAAGGISTWGPKAARTRRLAPPTALPSGLTISDTFPGGAGRPPHSASATDWFA